MKKFYLLLWLICSIIALSLLPFIFPFLALLLTGRFFLSPVGQRMDFVGFFLLFFSLSLLFFFLTFLKEKRKEQSLLEKRVFYESPKIRVEISFPTNSLEKEAERVLKDKISNYRIQELIKRAVISYETTGSLFNVGIGSKVLGKNLFYLRDRDGNRVFLTPDYTNKTIYIVGISNKKNEENVINILNNYYKNLPRKPSIRFYPATQQ